MMDSEGIQTFLQKRLPDAADLEVAKIRRAFPGMSRDTWMVQAEWTAEGVRRREGFVFRMDAPGGSIVPSPLRREYEVYRRLQGTAVPVPRTLWYEPDEGWLTGGREFYVRAMVEGTVEIPHLFDPGQEGERLRREVGRELMTKLAAVHTVDWRALGFGKVMEVPPDAASSARFDLDLCEEIFDRERVEPHPLLRLIFSWLREHQPPPTPRICLCKGNNGIGEEVWRGTEIVAMTDWEMAHLGDPAEDWVSIELGRVPALRGIDELFDQSLLLECYEAASGITIDPERVQYYGVLRALKSMVNVVAAARTAERAEAPRTSVVGTALAISQHLGPFARQLGLIS